MLDFCSFSNGLAALVLAGGISVAVVGQDRDSLGDDVASDYRHVESGLGLPGTIIWLAVATVLFVPGIVRDRHETIDVCSPASRSNSQTQKDTIELARMPGILSVDACKPQVGEIRRVSREFFPKQTRC